MGGKGYWMSEDISRGKGTGEKCLQYNTTFSVFLHLSLVTHSLTHSVSNPLSVCLGLLEAVAGAVVSGFGFGSLCVLISIEWSGEWA